MGGGFRVRGFTCLGVGAVAWDALGGPVVVCGGAGGGGVWVSIRCVNVDNTTNGERVAVHCLRPSRQDMTPPSSEWGVTDHCVFLKVWVLVCFLEGGGQMDWWVGR